MVRIFLLTVVVVIITYQCSANRSNELQLNLQYWPISKGLATPVKWENIHYIKVTGKDLNALNKNTNTKLESLYKLDVSNNAIQKIEPDAFINLPSLREINLSSNLLENIDKFVFNKLNVGKLDMHNNNIKFIDDDAFDDLAFLRTLLLNNNRLKFINNEWFKNCPKLRHINLSHNEIAAVPADAFKHLKGTISPNYHSLDIILTGNKIKMVHPKAFQAFKRLETVKLDHNQIKTLNEHVFENTEHISSLNLENNEISCLPEKLKHVLVGEIIYLEHNPWKCDCAEQVHSYARKNAINVKIDGAIIDCQLDRIEKKMEGLKNVLNKNKLIRT